MPASLRWRRQLQARNPGGTCSTGSANEIFATFVTLRTFTALALKVVNALDVLKAFDVGKSYTTYHRTNRTTP